MPLTAERLKEIQDECLADDVDVPPEATAWTDEQAYEFFESGGKTLPRIGAGFQGAEIHTFYELNQQRFESTSSDAMLDALSSALFKTTGDAKYKPGEPEEAEKVPTYGTRQRDEKHEPEQKYEVKQLGTLGSSTYVYPDDL